MMTDLTYLYEEEEDHAESGWMIYRSGVRKISDI